MLQGDLNADVRGRMINAGIIIIDKHGRDNVSLLFPIFENYLNKKVSLHLNHNMFDLFYYVSILHEFYRWIDSDVMIKDYLTFFYICPSHIISCAQASDEEKYDLVREGVVIFTGALAKHLAKV